MTIVATIISSSGRSSKILGQMDQYNIPAGPKSASRAVVDEIYAVIRSGDGGM